MNLENAKKIGELLSAGPKILLVPHKNPDGDAIGACLGMYHFLRASGQEAVVLAPNDFPDFLKWMPGADSIRIYDSDPAEGNRIIKECGLIFTLDFNALDRTGNMLEPLEAASADLVMIDHHQSPEGYAMVQYSDPGMSSTCEMVYHTIAAMDGLHLLDAAMAHCLYTGILTDTGSFKYSATTPTTMRIAANLMEKGANHTEIHRRIYDTNRPQRLQLLGCALGNMKILPEYRTAYITLSQEELDRHGFRKGDTEGFVNYGLSLEGIILAAIFIENRDQGIIKISFRSQGDFSVNDLAREHFNGGGHINAAGGRSETSMETTVARFEELLPAYAKWLVP